MVDPKETRATEKGQIVIPLDIRQRYDLTPGTQVEFVDEGGAIRLVIRPAWRLTSTVQRFPSSIQRPV